MILDSFRLDDQVALVTGSRQGIGRAIAVALAEAGAHIVGMDRNEPAETREAVQQVGRRYEWIKADLLEMQVADLDAAVARVHEQMGRLDILVNNAGIIRRGPVLNLSETDWDAVMQVDLKSVFFLSQAAARGFVAQRRGKIIHIASVLSFQGGILVPAYTAAKHALAGITRAMATEWAPLGVNVNAIAPGYITTTNTTSLHKDAERSAAIVARVPVGRWGEPHEVAGAAVFLASAASDFVHGAVLAVDGGWLAR